MSAFAHASRSASWSKPAASALNPIRDATLPLPARSSKRGAKIATRIPRSR